MPEVIETGLEREFFLTDVVKAERAGSGAVRIYFASDRHGDKVIQFSVVATPEDFAKMAKQVVILAAQMDSEGVLALLVPGDDTPH